MYIVFYIYLRVHQNRFLVMYVGNTWSLNFQLKYRLQLIQSSVDENLAI